MSSRPVFSLDDDEPDEQTEFAITDMTASLGELDDLPPELRDALIDTKPPLLKRSPLFEQSPPPPAAAEPDTVARAIPLPERPETRDTG